MEYTNLINLPLCRVLPSAYYQEGGIIGNYETTLVNDFMKLLDKKINEAKDMLIERFDWICSQPAKSAQFMYENGTFFGYKPEEGIHSALKHGTLAIGQLGLAECLQILIGKDHTTEEGMKLAIEIETLFKENVNKARILYEIPEQNRPKAIELLKQKEEIIEKNGFFANFQLSKINKELEKLKKSK